MAEAYAVQQQPDPRLRLSSNYNLQGLDLRLSPFTQPDGEFIKLVNVDPYPIGALTKRSGLTPYLNNPDNAAITQLFSWRMNDNSTFWNYRISGGTMYYSTQGTGNWTICGNGTFTAGSYVGFDVLNNTLIVGDGAGSTRHTTNGTSFTNTTGAPIAQYFANYQNRIYAAGTNPSISFSVTGDLTNWATTGTSDGGNLTVSGPGGYNGLMKIADRLVISKNSNNLYRWDGQTLVDMASRLGPTSPYFGSVEDSRIYLNRRGYCLFDGNSPQIISNPIQPQIYNNIGSAIVGGTFDKAPATVYRYNYYSAVGTVTDDITRETVSNCMQIYNYQLNTWRNYSMGTPITALHYFRDNTLNDTFIMGDNGGQAYTFGGSTYTDNGLPIEAQIELVYHGGIPQYEKDFDYIWLFFNPGCQAHVQVAVASTWTREKLRWNDLGDVTDGVVEYHFKNNERGRLLFVKIIESSRNTPFTFYGLAVDWDVIQRT